MKSTFATLFAAIAALALHGPAGADASFECGIDNGSQVEIGNCVGRQLEAVDKSVDLALGFATNAAKELDGATGRAAAVPALEKGQAAWSAYRDAHCDFVGATFGGGSGTGIAIASCRIELGRSRVRELMLYAR